MNFIRPKSSCFLKCGIVTLMLLLRGFKVLLFAQSGLCDPTTPFYNVDLSANPNSSWTSPIVARKDYCCGVSGTDRCIEFLVTLAPSAVALKFDVASGANPPGWFYQINCGPQIPMGTPICLSGPGPYTITFCKPGANLNTYKITSIGGPTGSPDKTVGNGCTTTMSINGVVTSSIIWNSIYPGATGAYNSYLSCATACSTTVVTSQPGHPPYVDYRVCGTTLGVPPCLPAGTFCDTIRVYMSTPVLNVVNPNPASFCANNPSVLLTGTVNGGVPPYTYAWTNGPNGTGTVVGTGVTYTATAIGNYSFIVYDQNYPACPAPITNVTVSLSPTPTINAGPDKTLCGTTVSLNGTVTGATGGIWSGGSGTFSPGNNALNATYTPTPAERTNGTVILTLTSTGNGACNPVSDQVVLFITPPIIATISSPPVICFGQTALIVANVSGGVAPYTYLWNTGQTTQSISNALPGTYSVTVTGGAPGFCSSIASVVLTANPQIIVSTSPNNVIVCSSTATISASGSGGTGALSYLWSNGATTASTNVYTGTYGITVTDAVGCSANNFLSVTASSSLAATINQPTVLCFGTTTSLAVTVTGGLGGNSYLWSNGATSASISVGAGNYCVNVTDAGGCITTACVAVTQDPAISVSVPSPAIVCNGASANINTTVSGGQPPYTFLWNTGQTTQSLVAPAGTYTVTVNDFTGCVKNASVTISQASAINIATSSVAVGCFGGNNGSATAIVSGGFPSYFYSWSPYGGASATATTLLAGSYTVTVTDTMGCAKPAVIIVSEPLALAATITVQNQVSCNGGNNGAAIVNPTGGTPAYAYAWNPLGGTIQNPVNLSAGSYTVTVTDIKGCVKTVQTTITEPALLTASIVSTTDVSCNGGSNGSATIIAAGGSPAYTYSWSPSGGTNATANNLAVGSYTVTITDLKSCSTQVTIIINQPTTLTSMISNSTNVLCSGGSNGSATAAPSGGTSPYTYAWNTSPVQTTATATNLAVGTYSVVVKDFKNCISTSVVTITSPPAVSVTASASSFVSCDTIITIFASTVIGGTGGYTYLWNTGATTSSINVSTGEYIITVSDVTGCSGSDTVSVLASNSSLIATITQPPNICFGTTATITVNVTGGLGVSSYLWNTNATTASITAPAGSYCVAVTDVGGCITTACVTIIQNPQIGVTIPAPQNICPGATATVTAAGTGGQPAYSYLWNSFETTQSVTKPAGTYTVTISDVTGTACSASASVTIAPAPVINTTMSSTNVGCYGANNGTASVAASGGAPGYTYSWAPSGGTNASAVLLGPGTYTVTVTDSIGCVKAGNVTITQPLIPVAISLSGTDNLCFGDSAGTATAAGNGGSSPYFYYWLPNGDSVTTITGLAAGTYGVTVADNSGCFTSSSFVVSDPPQLIFTSVVTPLVCFGGTGSVTLTAAGGTGALVITGDNTANLYPGTYNYTVTDANACTANVSAIIDPSTLSPLSIAATSNQITCFGGTGTVTLTASGGTGALTISGDDTTDLITGTYNYTVTDSTGCTSTTQAVIDPSPAAVLITATVSQISCFGGKGSVALVTSGGTGTIIITGDATSNLSAGTYNYTATDPSGCFSAAQAIINTEPALLTVTVSSTQIKCFGSSDGTATAIINGGTAPFNYTWQNGATTATITNLATGTYSVAVADAKGCLAASSPVSIAEPAEITLSGTTVASTCGLNNGSATITAQGGTGAYSYVWSPSGGVAAMASNLLAGNYTVAVADSNTCQKTLQLTVAAASFLIANFTATEVCFNNPTLFTDSSITSSGSTITSWEWDFGNLAPLDNSQAPTYVYPAPGPYNVSLTVTSSNGCVSTLTQPVLVHYLPFSDFVSSKICLGAATSFTDLSIVLGNDNISSWEWDFGDLSDSSTTQNPTHIYSQPGTHNAVLLVTSDYGCSDTATMAVIVYPSPVANFIVSDSSGCLIHCPVFTDTSVPVNGTITNWQWNYGDGSPLGTNSGEEHCYNSPGVFAVSLTVTNSNGCSADTTKTNLINVYQSPVAEFNYAPQEPTSLSSEIYFNNLSVGASSWSWNFGDINNTAGSFLEFPSHNYTLVGNYCITLIAQNNNQCIDTVVHCLEIEAEFTFFIPNAFSPTDSEGINDGFTGFGTNISKYDMWIFDRWGDMIFHTEDLRKGWDGKANGGKEMAQRDVYVYLVKLKDFKGIDHSYRGIVTLVR